MVEIAGYDLIRVADQSDEFCVAGKSVAVAEKVDSVLPWLSKMLINFAVAIEIRGGDAQNVRPEK